MARRTKIGLALLFAALAPSTARAEEKPIDWTFGAQYRVRGFGLRNGTFIRQLDPATRLALRQNTNGRIAERQTFMDTRLRFKAAATVREEVTLQTQFEIGDIVFGGPGGGLGTDGVNIETKWLYLDWSPGGAPLSFRAGLFSEVTPRSLILSNDVAGLRTQYSPFGGAIVATIDYIQAIDSSRLDLDGDGLLNNDFNDRTIWIGRIDLNKFRPFTLGAYFIADIDNTQDTPLAQNIEQDIYWIGLSLRHQIGRVALSADGIFAYGDRRNALAATGQGSSRIEGHAIDVRAAFELSPISFEIILGWASGDDPKTSANEAFPTITTFYSHSNIIFDDTGGFNLTGSNLSGMGHISLIANMSPLDKVDLKAFAIWAVLTSDPRRSTNVNRRNLSGRDFGLELGLNPSYHVNENFKLTSKNAIFFPSGGYRTLLDSSGDGPVIEVMLGASLNF